MKRTHAQPHRPFGILWLPLSFLPPQKQVQWCIYVCKKTPMVYKHIEMLCRSMALNHSDAKFPPFISPSNHSS